jgi:hypothetical protein
MAPAASGLADWRCKEEVFMRIAFALAAVVGLAGQAEAVTLINGSFESGSFGAAAGIGSNIDRQTLPVGEQSNLMPGWNVFGAGVDNVGEWSASAGQRSLDLGPAGAGITQRLSGFDPNRTYRLTFDLSANPLDPASRPRDKRLLVSASGETPQLYLYRLTDANSPTSMNYRTYRYDFRPVSETQYIRFSSLNNDGFGPVIDNVSLSVVPEAASWALLITGFSAIGVLARRRRTFHPRVTA